MELTPFPRSLDYPEVPVGSVLAGAAARWGSRTAFAHGDQSLTFAETYSAACRFANALRAEGIGRGDVVALHLPNCLAYPVAYYGTLLAGATFSPANPLLPPEDLAAQLADAGAVAAVTVGPVARVLASVRDRTSVRLTIVVHPPESPGQGEVEFTVFHSGHSDERPDVEIDIYRDLAHLAYTGGTTGRSKGVRLPHRNVVVNSLQSSCWRLGAVPAVDSSGEVIVEQLGGPDEWPSRIGTGIALNLTPWFHAMGTIAALNVPLLDGGTIVLHDRFDPAAYVADAELLRVTTIGGAPALFAALLACPEFHTADLSSVLTIGSGAAPMNHEMIRALQKRFPGVLVIEGYGLTEVTMGAVIAPAYRSAVRKVGSVGLPLPDTEIKIVPAEGGEDPLPAGESGEVCLRGPQVMIGYRDRPEETAAALVDGWLHTGDIGILDEDGYLSIVDRKKDMLLYKGYNVFPRELEELLITLPGVAAAAVVGKPDTEVGELPVAFVVRSNENVTAEQLLEAVGARVLPYKRLRAIHFVDQIPVSAAGKVLKRELRKQLAD
ncbi:class I adenylate-forming enzyme family protein [Amycolatopsis sp. EV170708-02-1]|uniref:class I adenylate-forming enzyme family protein n=1 Tax=Amycolatopsis sp. EV170708-02-1 TaxID=2919322 RepID=UPI001F0BC705|nr:AMP-binding protein [Amycolatopsis sp. EV170708-02-1]UMP01886.1 AMP-binding protein [Amycolatopsis sp. EV170708-02-1]